MTPAVVALMKPEHLRFYRLIEERDTNGDGSEDCVLACGHLIHNAVPFSLEARYAQCGHCLGEWIKQERLHASAEQLLKLYLSAKGQERAGHATMTDVLQWSEQMLLVLEGSAPERAG